MSSPATGAHRVEEHFSLPLFLLTVAASVAAFGTLLYFAAPTSIWHTQLSAGPARFAAVFAAVSLFNCFMEYVFHRYVLHKPVVPFLSRFYKQHTLHHTLTRIGRRRTPGGRDVPFVENIYPILEPEQGEASFFPWYTFVVFAAIVTPLLAVAQWLAPSLPWFSAGYAALATSLLLYELFHAIEHWSFERWAPLIEHRHLGWFWRKVYSFHLRHHAVIDCNEAISGFFTLPVADVVLGTFVLPKTLYTDGAEWTPAEFASPRPCALIRWCDAQSDALIQRRRAAAQSPAAPVYSHGERIAQYFSLGTGLLASIAALVLATTFAALRDSSPGILVGTILFGVALVFGYSAFLNFRRVRATRVHASFSRRHHVAIFLLIAATATPFFFKIGGAWGWSLFGIVWGLCLTGALVRLFFAQRLKIISTFAYVLVGVVACVALKPLVATLPGGGLGLLFGGLACYLAGVVFHVWSGLRYHQTARQLFAVGGTACHLLAILLFVLPPAV